MALSLSRHSSVLQCAVGALQCEEAGPIVGDTKDENRDIEAKMDRFT
jgi:hypothetical protein